MFSFRTKTAAADAECSSTAIFTLDDIRDIVHAFPQSQSTGLPIEKTSQSLQETIVRQSPQDTVLPLIGRHGSRIANDRCNDPSNSSIDNKDEEDTDVEEAGSLSHEMDPAKRNKAIVSQLSAAKNGFLRLSDIKNDFESREELEEFLRKGAEIGGRRKQFGVFGQIAVPLDQLLQMAKRWIQLATKHGVCHVKVSLILSCKCHHSSLLINIF